MLVTDCLKANQGARSHKDVEWKIIHNFNTYTSITATMAKLFPGGKLQADILLSGITTIDNPAARNWYLDVTSTNPMGVTNHELISRAELGRQPGPGEHDPRNDVLTSAKRAEALKHAKYDAICGGNRVDFLTFRSRDDGRAWGLHRVGVLPLSRATRVCRRTCCWASSRRTSRSHYAGARLPK